VTRVRDDHGDRVLDPHAEVPAATGKQMQAIDISAD